MPKKSLSSPHDCTDYQSGESHDISHYDCSESKGCRACKWKELIPAALDAKTGIKFPKTTNGIVEMFKYCADRIVDELKSANNADRPFAQDLINVFISSYDTPYSSSNPSIHDSWEHCAKMKKDVHDSIFGCYSCFPNDPNEYFHPHQRRNYYFYKKSLRAMEEYVSRELDALNAAPSFDELHKMLRDEKKRCHDYSGFGAVCIYDTAYRLARHSGKWDTPDGEPDLRPKKIYLHAGVHWGAESLWHISRITGLDWLVYTPATIKRNGSFPDEPPIEMECFNPSLRAMEACHLENLLCCFHEPFYKLENAIRIRTENGGDIRLRRKIRNKEQNRLEKEKIYDCLKPEGYPSYDEWLKGRKKLK